MSSINQPVQLVTAATAAFSDWLAGACLKEFMFVAAYTASTGRVMKPGTCIAYEQRFEADERSS